MLRILKSLKKCTFNISEVNQLGLKYMSMSDM